MEFIYNRRELLRNLIYGYLLLAFTFFLLIMISRKIIIDWEEFTLFKIIFAYSFVILFALLTYQNLGIALIRKQYHSINQKREISIDFTERKILISNKIEEKIESVYFDKVSNVELYYSWNTHPFSSDLGYSKIFTENAPTPIIITQNNINQDIIYNSFKSKVSKRKYKYAHRIRENFY